MPADLSAIARGATVEALGEGWVPARALNQGLVASPCGLSIGSLIQMPADKPVIGVLDDEEEMRKAIRRLLGCHGFRVEEYASGEDFLAAVASQSLDCLLLDLHMEGVNGFDVLEVLRDRRISMPVIVITAHDEPDTESQVRALGAEAYLKKPVDRDVLLAAIDAARSVAKDPTIGNRP